MKDLIARLNQNYFFKYVSSIRLAVPVMVGLIVAVAVGTVIESRHNAEYAKIALYNASWFHALLFLLALNVFCAMMSRYPWKIHQTGFVVTHIGILILLAGSWVTKIYGVDGSLQVQEGESQNTVVLPRLMIGYQFEGSPTLTSVIFSKTLWEKKESQLSFINDEIGHILKAKHFVPFAEVEKGYSSGDSGSEAVGISFGLKSAFFDVKDWLHSEDNPEFQMGPATLKLILDSPDSAAAPAPPVKRVVAEKKSESGLIVLDAQTKKQLKVFSLQQLKQGVVIQGVRVVAEKVYQRALVAENKIVESEDPTAPLNPALELRIEKGSEKLREVLYAKFPGFSLNQDGAFGLRFQFQPDNFASMPTKDLPAGHPTVDSSSGGGAPNIEPGRNVIEFHVNRQQKDQVRVVLLKAGEKVGEQIMKEGDIFQTPWMGMQLFLASINFGSQSQVDVRAVSPPPGKNLPTSALQIQPLGADRPLWLVQGDVKKISVAGRNAFVVFSNETLSLPFELKLDQFSKKDYPGTETPYSYESLVTNNRDQKQTLISMNEPLKADGFTLYQASFSMTPGQKPISVLSVNKDPGRWIKYLGSLILSIGVILFTLMKSRLYKNWTARKLA